MTENDVLGRRSIREGRDGYVEIIIYTPKMHENGDFYCDFRITGVSQNISRKGRTHGVDAIQALYLSLQSIGSDLKALQQERGYNLVWVGGKYDGDFGFPIIDFQFP